MAEIVGTDSDDTLSPGQSYPGGMPRGGPDALFGLLGNDSLDRGGGNDTLTGDAGDDSAFADLLRGDDRPNRLTSGAGPVRIAAATMLLSVGTATLWPALVP